MEDYQQQLVTATYQLVLPVSATVYERVMQVKQAFADAYDCPAAALGKPQIGLLRFTQFDLVEARLLPRLHAIIRATAPMMVELKDFGSLPTHTILLQVASQTAIGALVKSLRPLQSMLQISKTQKPHYFATPHLTIARKLLPWQYEKGWQVLQHTHFTERFMANEVMLFRKKEGEQYPVAIAHFPLTGIRQRVEQATLF